MQKEPNKKQTSQSVPYPALCFQEQIALRQFSDSLTKHQFCVKRKRKKKIPTQHRDFLNN